MQQSQDSGKDAEPRACGSAGLRECGLEWDALSGWPAAEILGPAGIRVRGAGRWESSGWWEGVEFLWGVFCVRLGWCLMVGYAE